MIVTMIDGGYGVIDSGVIDDGHSRCDMQMVWHDDGVTDDVWVMLVWVWVMKAWRNGGLGYGVQREEEGWEGKKQGSDLKLLK